MEVVFAEEEGDGAFGFEGMVGGVSAGGEGIEVDGAAERKGGKGGDLAEGGNDGEGGGHGCSLRLSSARVADADEECRDEDDYADEGHKAEGESGKAAQ